MQGATLTSGALIGDRYRLEYPLGEGGMGSVWAAEHTVTHRAVAMKFLSEAVRHKPQLRQRFLREAATASALRHPHVVEIIDVFDYAPEAPVLVMERLAGETLGRKLARDERLGIEETAALLLPVVSAMGVAHALGVVHRDLKPENIFITQKGDEFCPKVLDFGIAKLAAELFLQGHDGNVLTNTGAMLGTPCYMAPEQAEGDASLDFRADIWSLGVILYECLSGVRPVEGDNLAQVVTRLVSAAIIPLERLAPELPHEVSATVMQMLSRDAKRRPGLDAVALVLSRYTRVKVPAFGSPKHRDERGQASNEPRAKVTNTVSADPQGITLLSSPPVASSVAGRVEALDASRGERPRLNPVLGALLGVVLVGGLLLWSRARKPEAPAGPALSGTAESGESVARSSASAAPTGLVSQAQPAPSASSRPAPDPLASAEAKRTPHAAKVELRAVPARTAPVRANAASRLDEATLFSGRK